MHNNNNNRPEINYAEGTRKRKLVLVVDVREGKNELLLGAIRRRMEELGAADQLEVRQLEIFDFQYVFFDDREKTFGPHIERKTAADAAKSITDKRWGEQIGRAHHVPNKIHIFEGNLLAKYYGIHPKALIGAVLKPAMRHEFDATMTQNMEATADMLVQWFMYLEHVDDVKVVEQFTYVEYFQGECRKRDFRENNSLALMIKSFVHGGSAGVANAVSDIYHTLGELQAAFLSNPAGTMRDIANLKHFTTGTNMRRIGPAATREIYKMCDIDCLAARLSDSGPAVVGVEEEKKKRKAPATGGLKLKESSSKKKKMIPIVRLDPLEDIDDDDDDDDDGEKASVDDQELAALMDKIEGELKRN